MSKTPSLLITFFCEFQHLPTKITTFFHEFHHLLTKITTFFNEFHDLPAKINVFVSLHTAHMYSTGLRGFPEGSQKDSMGCHGLPMVFREPTGFQGLHRLPQTLLSIQTSTDYKKNLYILIRTDGLSRPET